MGAVGPVCDQDPFHAGLNLQSPPQFWLHSPHAFGFTTLELMPNGIVGKLLVHESLVQRVRKAFGDATRAPRDPWTSCGSHQRTHPVRARFDQRIHRLESRSPASVPTCLQPPLLASSVYAAACDAKMVRRLSRNSWKRQLRTWVGANPLSSCPDRGHR